MNVQLDLFILGRVGRTFVLGGHCSHQSGNDLALVVAKEDRDEPSPREDVDPRHPEFTHADGRVERVQKTAPVNSRRGAEQYERDLRTALLNGTYGKASEVPTVADMSVALSSTRASAGSTRPESSTG